MSKTPKTFKPIGSNLRALRKEAGLTLKEVAAAVRLDVSLLSKVERGIRLPTEEQCNILAGFYGVAPDSFARDRLLSKVYSDLETHPELNEFVDQVREPDVLYLDSKTKGVMGLLDFRRLDVARQISSERQARLGQFFTPSNIAEFMAEMLETASVKHMRVLDAGAGIGSLTAALVMKVLRQPVPPKSIEVTAFEIDPFVRSDLEATLNLCRNHCHESGVRFSAEIVQKDFILHTRHQFENGLFGAAPQLYTHAILNPPYKK